MIKIIVADYNNPQQAIDLVYLLDQYAQSPEGGGTELSSFAKENVVTKLAQLPGAFSLLAYVEDNPVGLINTLTLFSTFKCKPVFYLHDVFVLPEYRRQGICQLLLNKLEEIAKEKDVCRLCLAVFQYNNNAKNAYAKFGFVGGQLNPEYGTAQFLEKEL